MTLLGTPKLGSTDLLHVLKRELLVIVKVVQDLDIHIMKGEVGRGLEGAHEDRLQDIVNSEGVQVAQSLQVSFIFPKWVLTLCMESLSHFIICLISRARRTVCIHLCSRGTAARRASQTFFSHRRWAGLLVSKTAMPLENSNHRETSCRYMVSSSRSHSCLCKSIQAISLTLSMARSEVVCVLVVSARTNKSHHHH